MAYVSTADVIVALVTNSGERIARDIDEVSYDLDGDLYRVRFRDKWGGETIEPLFLSGKEVEKKKHPSKYSEMGVREL